MVSPHTRIGTCSSNASKHPGLASKPATHQTSAEVKAAAKAKEVAKKAKKEAQQAHLKHVAEFETMVKMNKDMTDATPHPNFAPHGTNLDSDMGHNSDGYTLAPPGGSDDSSDDSDFIKSAETLIPKIVIPTQLATIAKNSRDESKPVLLKKAHILLKRIILEETGSDGFSPLMKNWKPKLK